MAAAVEGFSVERAGLALPDSIESLYPRALNRSIHLLESDVEEAYPSRSSDEFVKDARLVMGYSVPAGAQDVDLDHGVRSRSLLKHALTTGDPVPLASLLVSSIRDRWYEIHTDGRDLADFSEEGWRECYRRIGQLLQADPTAAGVVGTSWFFDPQLADVSPHLAYLRALPVSEGAALIRNGPGELHTRLATSTSRTRRRLFEEGRYTPVCHTIVWPRDALLRWAASEAER